MVSRFLRRVKGDGAGQNQQLMEEPWEERVEAEMEEDGIAEEEMGEWEGEGEEWEGGWGEEQEQEQQYRG